jgi:hypothetical protein
VVARKRGTGREGEMKRGKSMGMGAYDVVSDAGERTGDMGCESKRDVEGEGRREREVEGSKGLRVRDGMRVRGEVMGCPRRFGSKGGVGRGKKRNSRAK